MAVTNCGLFSTLPVTERRYAKRRSASKTFVWNNTIFQTSDSARFNVPLDIYVTSATSLSMQSRALVMIGLTERKHSNTQNTRKHKK